MQNKTEKLSSDTPRNFGLLFKTTENYTYMYNCIILLLLFQRINPVVGIFQSCEIFIECLYCNFHLTCTFFPCVDLIMIQLFKFLPRIILMFLFLAKTDTSIFADQSSHSCSKFLQMSFFSHPGKIHTTFFNTVVQTTLLQRSRLLHAVQLLKCRTF